MLVSLAIACKFIWWYVLIVSLITLVHVHTTIHTYIYTSSANTNKANILVVHTNPKHKHKRKQSKYPSHTHQSQTQTKTTDSLCRKTQTPIESCSPRWWRWKLLDQWNQYHLEWCFARNLDLYPKPTRVLWAVLYKGWIVQRSQVLLLIQ